MIFTKIYTQGGTCVYKNVNQLLSLKKALRTDQEKYREKVLDKSRLHFF